jgi:AAA+ ATPase superfamily predicted ATPase
MEIMAGRVEEAAQMRQLLGSNKSEFLAIYGRRRVGKTFLIRNVYKADIVFQMTGIAGADMSQQLTNFFSALQLANPANSNAAIPENWFKAFEQLRDLLERSKKQKKVVFFDELPWIDTPRSNFLSGLEHFWNSWASSRDDIILVVCGSATSWMLSKLINNKGGLHNRVTQRIRLLPFDLRETEAYFSTKNIVLDRYQIVQLYMAMGGIPFYLNEIMPGRSAFQEIERLCFMKGGILVNEYDNLYRSLFSGADRHMTVIEVLSQKNKGMTRSEIIEAGKLENGGNTTKVLLELEESGFITKIYPFEKKVKTTLYRLTDQYSLFYLNFIKDSRAFGEGAWLSRIDNPGWRAWSGYAFENICFSHIGAIKRALGIGGVYTEVSSWSNVEKGVQIDLLIDRRDQVISLCEIKFSQDVYSITKAYRGELEKKVSAFRTVSKTRKSVFLTMITTFGLEQNVHSIGFVQNIIKLEDLFG